MSYLFAIAPQVTALTDAFSQATTYGLGFTAAFLLVLIVISLLQFIVQRIGGDS